MQGTSEVQKDFNVQGSHAVHEFTLRTSDLAEHHGVTVNCIAKWVREGAFPHGLTAGQLRPSPMFHPAVLDISPGKLKKNRESGAHSKPLFKLEKKEDQKRIDYVKKEDFEKILDMVCDLSKRVTHLQREFNSCCHQRPTGGKKRGR